MNPSLVESRLAERDVPSRMRRWCAAALIAVLSACGGGGGGDSGGTPAPTSASVRVSVTDTGGAAVGGVAVGIAGTTTRVNTDATGVATLQVPLASEVMLSFSKTGYGEQIKPVASQGAVGTMELPVTLVAREGALTIAAIEGGGSATGKHGAKVTF